MHLFRKKSKDKSSLNYLDMTPIQLYGWEYNDTGMIDVLVPKFQWKFAQKYLIPRNKSPFIRANLDKFGTESWLLINGLNKVKSISEKLWEKFGDEIHPLPDRLIAFLNQLYVNSFISFIELQKGNNNAKSSCEY